MTVTYPTTILGSTASRSAPRPLSGVEPDDTGFSRQMGEAERDRFSLSDNASRANAKATPYSPKEDSGARIDDRDAGVNSHDLPSGTPELQFVWHSSISNPCETCPEGGSSGQQIGKAVPEAGLALETAGALTVADGSPLQAEISGLSTSLTKVADGLVLDGLIASAAADRPMAEGTFATPALPAQMPKEPQLSSASLVTGGATKVRDAATEPDELKLGVTGLAANELADGAVPSDKIEFQAHRPAPTLPFMGKWSAGSDGQPVPSVHAKPAEQVAPSFDTVTRLMGGTDGSETALTALTFRHGLAEDLSSSPISAATHSSIDLTASSSRSATTQDNHFALTGDTGDAPDGETLLGPAYLGSDQGNQVTSAGPITGDAEISFSGPAGLGTGFPALPLAESALLSALETDQSAVSPLPIHDDRQALPAATSPVSRPYGSMPSITVAQIVEVIGTQKSGDVELRLSPEELGQVRISMQEEGERMVVRISAERPETLDLLRRNADQLAAELRASGQLSLSMSFGNWNGPGHNGDHAAQTSAGIVEPSADTPKAGPHPKAANNLHSGLYLRI